MDGNLLAQGIGIVAMALGISSFQLKTQRAIVVLQFFSSLLFTIHYFLLGAFSGSMLNLLGVIRAAVYSRRDRSAVAASPVWVYVFTAVSLGMYAASFLVFQTEPTLTNFLLEILPVIGMFASTISFRMKSAAAVRRITAIGCPFWLTYNIFRASLGGTLTEIFMLFSILIGFLRLDRGNEPDDK